MAGDTISINDISVLEAIFNNYFTQKCVIVDSEARIEWDQWLITISFADFFLCPPGIVMPMCHNVIEAMSVGTIPIINYAEWLSPNLRHLENCIVFHDENDLIEKIGFVLKMDSDQISAIKENVVHYFETYLNPVTFVQRLERSDESMITVLMYSERNVAKNSSKLNSKSIVIRGEEAAGEWALAKKYLPIFQH